MCFRAGLQSFVNMAEEPTQKRALEDVTQEEDDAAKRQKTEEPSASADAPAAGNRQQLETRCKETQTNDTYRLRVHTR